MTLRSRPRRQFQLESLERRDTPSAGASGTMQALATKAFSFSGSATGSYSSVDAATFHGSASHLGAYTGTLNATGSNCGAIVLSTSNGEIDLNSVGKYGKASRAGIIHGTFHFTVTGGTGEYAGATGSGTIKATVDHNTGALPRPSAANSFPDSATSLGNLRPTLGFRTSGSAQLTAPRERRHHPSR